MPPLLLLHGRRCRRLIHKFLRVSPSKIVIHGLRVGGGRNGVAAVRLLQRGGTSTACGEEMIAGLVYGGTAAACAVALSRWVYLLPAWRRSNGRSVGARIRRHCKEKQFISRTSPKSLTKGGTFSGLGDPLLLLGRLQDLERAHQRVVHAHHGARIVELSAVVGRAEDGHQLPASKELVSFLHHLMRSADQVEVVSAQEVRHHVFSEGEGDASVVLAPAHDVLVGIRPQQVAQQTGVGYI